MTFTPDTFNVAISGSETWDDFRAHATDEGYGEYNFGILQIARGISILGENTLTVSGKMLACLGVNDGDWVGQSASIGNRGSLNLRDGSTFMVHEERERTVANFIDAEDSSFILTGVRNDGGFNDAHNSRIIGRFIRCAIINQSTIDGTESSNEGMGGDPGTTLRSCTFELRSGGELLDTSLWSCNVSNYVTNGEFVGIEFNNLTDSVAGHSDGNDKNTSFIDITLKANCSQDARILQAWNAVQTVHYTNIVDERFPDATAVEWFNRNFGQYVNRAYNPNPPLIYYARDNTSIQGFADVGEIARLTIFNPAGSVVSVNSDDAGNFGEQRYRVFTIRLGEPTDNTTGRIGQYVPVYGQAGSEFDSVQGYNTLEEELTATPEVEGTYGFRRLIDAYGYIPIDSGFRHIEIANGRGNIGTRVQAKLEVMAVDEAVTLTRAQVEALSEINYAEALYCTAQLYCVDNPQLGVNGNRIVDITDTAITSDYSIIIDSAASSLISFDGSEIIIRSNTFTGDIRINGSGTVMLINDATINGNIFDANGDSVAQMVFPEGFANPSVHISAEDADAEVNALFNGVSFRYRSVEYGGQTLWVRANKSDGDEIVTSIVLPSSAGENNFDILVTSIDKSLQQIHAKLDSAADNRSNNLAALNAAITGVNESVGSLSSEVTSLATSTELNVASNNILDAITPAPTTDEIAEAINVPTSEDIASAVNAPTPQEIAAAINSPSSDTLAEAVWNYDISESSTDNTAAKSVQETLSNSKLAATLSAANL